MDWLSIVQKSINFIEAHLLENINYEDIAEELGISSYYLHRVFNYLTQMTINSYIRNRRLSLAGKEIIETNSKITDIALKYGYDTPESFTKAFTRFHGVAPKYVRKNVNSLVLFNPLVVKVEIEGGKCMDYKIIKKESLKFLAIVKDFNNEIINDENNMDIPLFWDECYTKGIVDELIKFKHSGPKNIYGLCHPSKEGEKTFKYGIGILIDENMDYFDNASVKTLGFSIWEVEASVYAVFDCIGEDSKCISDTWTRVYREFIPQMGYKISKATDMEIYLENSSKNLFCELWIPIEK